MGKDRIKKIHLFWLCARSFYLWHHNFDLDDHHWLNKIFLCYKFSYKRIIFLLQMYIDPKNPRHGKEEAISLVALADQSHDGKLSLQEVLSKIDLFLGSKMVDTARSFHDEFWYFYLLNVLSQFLMLFIYCNVIFLTMFWFLIIFYWILLINNINSCYRIMLQFRNLFFFVLDAEE